MSYKKRPLEPNSTDNNDDLSSPPPPKEPKLESVKTDPGSLNEQAAPTSALTGIPCKAKKLGPTGWIEVTTTKGLKYYVSKVLNTTTWVCPPEALAWMIRREDEVKRSREEKIKKQESKKQLEAEDESLKWIRAFERLMNELKIPPILTFERAQKQMIHNKDFQAIPTEVREDAFKKARSRLLNKSNTSTSSTITSQGTTGTMSLIKQFEDKLNQLKQNNRLRVEHSLEDILSLFYTDERWLPIKDEAIVHQLIKDSLNKLKEERRQELERMGNEMREVFVKYFPNYLADEDKMMGKTLNDLLVDDTFAVNFLDTSNMSSFVKYIRDSLTSMEAAERTLFMHFAAMSDTDEMLGVVAEAWQSLCQSVWSNLVSSKKDNSSIK